METSDALAKKWVEIQIEDTTNNASVMTLNSLTSKRSKLMTLTTDNKKSSEETREDLDFQPFKEEEDCNKKKKEERDSKDKEKKLKEEESKERDLS